MSFLKRLFSFFGSSPSGGPASRGGSSSGKISLLAWLMSNNIKIDAKPCGVDGATAAIATCMASVISTEARIRDVALDVGGQCANCRAVRCCDHSVWIAMPLDTFRDLFGNQLDDVDLDKAVAFFAERGKKVDTAFILGCRVCQGIYESPNGHQSIVIAD